MEEKPPLSKSTSAKNIHKLRRSESSGVGTAWYLTDDMIRVSP